MSVIVIWYPRKKFLWTLRPSVLHYTVRDEDSKNEVETSDLLIAYPYNFLGNESHQVDRAIDKIVKHKIHVRSFEKDMDNFRKFILCVRELLNEYPKVSHIFPKTSQINLVLYNIVNRSTIAFLSLSLSPSLPSPFLSLSLSFSI